MCVRACVRARALVLVYAHGSRTSYPPSRSRQNTEPREKTLSTITTHLFRNVLIFMAVARNAPHVGTVTHWGSWRPPCIMHEGYSTPHQLLPSLAAECPPLLFMTTVCQGKVAHCTAIGDRRFSVVRLSPAVLGRWGKTDCLQRNERESLDVKRNK